MEGLQELAGLLLPVALISLGFAVGKTVELRHLRSLKKREAEYSDIVQSNQRHVPAQWCVRQAELVDGQAVIASDYFKTFAASLRNLFGGEVHSFETLMQRARREAVLRMLEKARQMGAGAVMNMRMETSTIGRGTGRGKGMATAEIHVYGTALCLEKHHDTHTA